MDIFFMAIYPEMKNVIFNKSWLERQPNILSDLVPEDKKYSDVVRVCDVRSKDLRLLSDIVNQKMICFIQ
jgi:mRNA-degrading endonuclease HigB of HigAB toxin-antitoxin module